MALHCLPSSQQYNVVSLWRGFVATELTSSLGLRIGTDTECAGCRRVERTASCEERTHAIVCVIIVSPGAYAGRYTYIRLSRGKTADTTVTYTYCISFHRSSHLMPLLTVMSIMSLRMVTPLILGLRKGHRISCKANVMSNFSVFSVA